MHTCKRVGLLWSHCVTISYAHTCFSCLVSVRTKEDQTIRVWVHMSANLLAQLSHKCGADKHVKNLKNSVCTAAVVFYFFCSLMHMRGCQHLQQKMASEGLDPSILDMDPDSPAPPQASGGLPPPPRRPANSSDEEDDEFSDWARGLLGDLSGLLGDLYGLLGDLSGLLGDLYDASAVASLSGLLV